LVAAFCRSSRILYGLPEGYVWAAAPVKDLARDVNARAKVIAHYLPKP
jgi:hypothetical protein